MIDTHTHLTFEPLLEQIDNVLNRARRAGVDRIITVGTCPDDARLALGLAQRFEHVYATVGVHPHHANRWTDRAQVMDGIRRLVNHDKIVAMGEMGLDRHYRDPPIADQQRLFAWQLEAARETDKAIIIHNREATDDVLAMIHDSGIDGRRFVFHCFTGNDLERQKILDTGAMISFTGIVTFDNASSLATCATRVPLDRLMVETDSPYLTPQPHRKIRPNEPCYAPCVAQFLARLRAVEEDEFVRIVDQNADRFFGLA